MSDAAEATQSKHVFRCSFCAKSQTEVKKLVAGPGVFICDECAGLSLKIIAESPATSETPEALLMPDNAPTEKLLLFLSGYDRAFESVGAGMQDIVDILREREVSWATIGDILGVSRQAAWKRFG